MTIYIDTSWTIGLINGKILPGKTSHIYVTVYCSIPVFFTVAMMPALLSIYGTLRGNPHSNLKILFFNSIVAFLPVLVFIMGEVVYYRRGGLDLVEAYLLSAS
jgi:hypothetical protein